MFGRFKKMTPDRFSRIVLDEIARVGGPKDYVFVPDTFMLKRDSDLINLRSVYEQYCGEKDDVRERTLRHFVAALISNRSTKPIPWDEARDKLVAVVRERAMFSQAETIWSIEYDRPPGRSGAFVLTRRLRSESQI